MLAFRHTSIEELHRGKYHPALDDPDVSWIKQEEMKQIMIEASEQLADLLRLRETDFDAYWKKIEYALRITVTNKWEL